MRTNSRISSQPSTQAAVDANKRDFLAALVSTGLLGGTLAGCAAQEQSDQPQLGATDGKLKCAESAAALRALAGAVGSVALLLGYWAPGDGGGGLFYWDAAVAADDGGTRLNSKTGTTSGWRRLYSGSLNVRWFGAKAATGANDRDAIQATISAAAAAGGSVYCPAGVYTIAGAGARSSVKDGVNITTGNIELFGEGDATIFKQANDSQFVLSVNRYDGGTADPAMNATGIAIRDISFVGPDNRSPLGMGGGGDEHVHLLNITAATEVLIEHCSFAGFQGDAIYLGGTSGKDGTERHNVDITIRNCLFDGIDNNNRNAISVIDGDGVLIEGNTFKRCTHPSEPGCIDVEPNTNTYHRARNIRIVNNHFSGCRGGGGNVCFVLRGAKFTLQPQNFTVIGNHFEGNTGVLFLNNTAAYDGPTNLVIKGNTGNNDYLCNLAGNIRNIVISDNAVTLLRGSPLGSQSTDVMMNCTVTGNTFTGNGAAQGLRVLNGSNIVISNNVFSQFTEHAIYLGGTGMGISLAKVSITNNIFDAVTKYSVMDAGGVDGRTCVYMNNVHSGMHSFPAWRTDTPGNPHDDTKTSSFTSATLPDDLPHGINISIVNMDPGVPSEGGQQGTLISHRMTTQPGYEKWTFQHFYHANNTLSPESFYLRRRNNASNSWTAWYKVKGA